MICGPLIALAVLMAASSSNVSNALSLRKRTRDGPQIPTDVARELIATSSTKVGLASTLATLHKAGLIKDEAGLDAATERSIKQKLTDASTNHSKAQTPYGPLVQTIDLGAEGASHWEYVHPLGYLWYLAQLSTGFADVMRNCTVDGRPLRIIIYADGLVPGNPFRPEASRKMQCIYWCIADWPAWLIARSFAWPVFSILRESVIKTIPGNLSRIMRIVLRIFFLNPNANFTKGVTIPCPSGDFMVQGVFCGFLCDLVGHKEVNFWKGHGGLMCCHECRCVINTRFRPATGDKVGISCTDRSKFGKRSDADIFTIIDDLKAYAARPAPIRGKGKGKQKSLEDLETEIGWNHNEHALLADVELRGIYKPSDHHLRDWMHTCVGDGIANTHIAAAMHTINQYCGIDPTKVQEFAALCHYPSKWGKLERAAFSPTRLKNTTIASFSNTMLTMVIVFHMFLDKFVAAALPDVVHAFTKLHHLVGLLRTGADEAMRHIAAIEMLLVQHLECFIELYGDGLKPKFHHSLHITDGMRWLGKLIACFVTERKHREIKASSIQVFRHFEHTVLTDVVNKTFQQAIRGFDLYRKRFLVTPHSCSIGGVLYDRARKACLEIGQVKSDDVVVLRDGAVGKVKFFWQRPGYESIVAELDVYEMIGGDVRFRSCERFSSSFVDVREFVDTCIWIYDSPAIMRVSLPPSLLYAA